MLNNYKTYDYEQATLTKDEYGRESLVYSSPVDIIASISPITKELENMIPNYQREKAYYLIKTRSSVNINDKIGGKTLIKHVRGDYYVAS